MNSKKTMNVFALTILFIAGTSVSHAMEREDRVHVPPILKTHPESGDEESLGLLEEKARRIRKIAEFKEEVQKMEENFQQYLAESAETQQKSAERRRILVETVEELASKAVAIKSMAAQLKAESEDKINRLTDEKAQLPISMQTQIDNAITDRLRAQEQELELQEGRLAKKQLEVGIMAEMLQLEEEVAQREIELFIRKKESSTAQIELLKKDFSCFLATMEQVAQATTEVFTVQTVVFTEGIELLKRKFLLCSLSIEKTKSEQISADLSKVSADLSKEIEELSKVMESLGNK